MQPRLWRFSAGLSVIFLAAFAFIGCEDVGKDNPVETGPDYSFIHGFWEVSDDNLENAPFQVFSFGPEGTGMLGSSAEMSQFTFSMTDSSIKLDGDSASRTLNYQMVSDTFRLIDGLGDVISYVRVVDTDTVYLEDNPELVNLTMPEFYFLHVAVHGGGGEIIKTLANGTYYAGVHRFLLDYPDTTEGSDFSIDAHVPGKWFARTCRTVQRRGNVSQETMEFADMYFDKEAYLLGEYYCSFHPRGTNDFHGTFEEWKELKFLEKQEYLGGYFRHNINVTGDAFYWRIGVYPEQFGFGWVDALDDDIETIEWDGTSEKLTEYRVLLGLEEAEED